MRTKQALSICSGLLLTLAVLTAAATMRQEPPTPRLHVVRKGSRLPGLTLHEEVVEEGNAKKKKKEEEEEEKEKEEKRETIEQQPPIISLLR